MSFVFPKNPVSLHVCTVYAHARRRFFAMFITKEDLWIIYFWFPLLHWWRNMALEHFCGRYINNFCKKMSTYGTFCHTYSIFLRTRRHYKMKLAVTYNWLYMLNSHLSRHMSLYMLLFQCLDQNHLLAPVVQQLETLHSTLQWSTPHSPVLKTSCTNLCKTV